MTIRRKLLTNCILISFVIHVAFFLILSPYKESSTPHTKGKVDVDFISLPKANLVQRRPIQIVRQSEQTFDPNVERREYSVKYLSTPTNKPTIQEITPSSHSPELITTVADLKPDRMPTLGFRSDKTDDAFSAMRSSTVTGRSSSGRSGRSGGQMSAGGKIQPAELRARITGSGSGIKGYYNMSLVRYEDSSDTISTNALAQLAKAMNKWTQVQTKVISEPMRLDDPGLVDVPIIYIASRRPFAFSERERQNLRKFFANGNFMIFTNSGENETQRLEVANSIGFELWRILGEFARNFKAINKSHEIFNGFFTTRKSDLPNLSGIYKDRRIIMIYDESGYGDAWVAEKNDKDRPYLQMGVNIIAYALITNPTLLGVKSDF